MQIEDIVRAAIQDAGLNLDDLIDTTLNNNNSNNGNSNYETLNIDHNSNSNSSINNENFNQIIDNNNNNNNNVDHNHKNDNENENDEDDDDDDDDDDPFKLLVTHNQKIDQILGKTKPKIKNKNNIKPINTPFNTTSLTTSSSSSSSSSIQLNGNDDDDINKIIKIFNGTTNGNTFLTKPSSSNITSNTPPKIRIIKLNNDNNTTNTNINDLIKFRGNNQNQSQIIKPQIYLKSLSQTPTTTSSSSTPLKTSQIKIINLKSNQITTLNDFNNQKQQQSRVIQIPKQQLFDLKNTINHNNSTITIQNPQFNTTNINNTTTTISNSSPIQITKVVSSKNMLQNTRSTQQQHHVSAPLLRLCGGNITTTTTTNGGNKQIINGRSTTTTLGSNNNNSTPAVNLYNYLASKNAIKSQQTTSLTYMTTNQIDQQHVTTTTIPYDEEIVVDEEEELGHAETYSDYMPSKLKIGIRHPDPIVETSSLASVEPPEVWYKLRMPSYTYEDGALSALQLEAIVYACQKHETFLPNNHRAGFLIGDGAGVGKGRTIAGIIYENYLLNRKKSLWLSVSNDLKYDAQRDLNDIGAHRIDVHALNKLKYCKINSKSNLKIKKGVLFATYSSLIGESQNKNTKKKYNTRMKQLIQWLGTDFDGVIVFDECHKAKNLVPVGSAKPTKTGLAVLELQEKLPNARIIYASATGASEPKNMAYMVRLGLWGPGTPFKDFNEFIQCIEKRGVGAMEIVAMDMKLRGMYMARQLSFSGVTFKIQEIKLKDEYIQMYNESVKLWVHMKEKFQEALELIDTDGRLRKTIWGQFWSAHQRFFKYLCMASKVTHVVDIARNALHSSKCVVIGLQSTGESRTIEQLDDNNGELNEFVSTAKGVLQNLIEKHFPTCELVNNGSNNNNSASSTNVTNNSGKQTFLDILGIGDHIREQLNGNNYSGAGSSCVNGKKLSKKSINESKNNKVNEIIKRLSSYTNQNPVNNSQQKIKKENQGGGGDTSSSSASENTSDEEEEEEEEEESEKSGDDDEIKKNKRNRRDSIDNGYDIDEEDEDEEEEYDDDDEEEEEEEEDDDDVVQQLNLNVNKTQINENECNNSGNCNNNKKDNNNDSDDSDSLFSIVRTSVNLSNTTLNNNSNTSLNLKKKKKFRKKRKKITKIKKNDEENDDENDSDDDDDDEVNNEYDEQTSSSKRIKLEDNNNNIENETTNNKILKDDSIVKTKNFNQIGQYLNDIRNDMFERLKKLSKCLPPNTLDELIDTLDGPRYVAEMTGRKGRVVAHEDGIVQYETRNESDNVPLELLNIVQKERFMNGEKLIAIISEAASSGISLQANRRCANQRRRVHVTIELPWSADRAIQQFGRTHRSNQVNAPEYIFLISELAGEKRFASTVAKRLESLGALTHGDRRATETRDLSRFNIDNKYGRAALENVIKSICGMEKPLAKIPLSYCGENFFVDARNALNGVGLINKTCTNKQLINGICSSSGGGIMNQVNYYPEKDYTNINKFLNRLLGCPVNLQNAIFNYFNDVLTTVILEAKRTGKWDMGILDLGTNTNSCESVFKTKTKYFILNNQLICNNNGKVTATVVSNETFKQENDTRKVQLHTVVVERGLPWEKAFEMASSLKEPQGFYISNHVKNNHRIAILAVYSSKSSNINDDGSVNDDVMINSISNIKSFSIYRPNTGLQVRQETLETLNKKYKRVSSFEAQEHWNEQYYKSIVECTHVYRQGMCKNERNCEIGLRNRKYNILAGSVLTVWTKIENVISTLLGTQQCKLQIIRLKTTNNEKIVGCVIPTLCTKKIEILLNSLSQETYERYENTDLFEIDCNNNNNSNNNNNNNKHDEQQQQQTSYSQVITNIQNNNNNNNNNSMIDDIDDDLCLFNLTTINNNKFVINRNLTQQTLNSFNNFNSSFI